MIDVLKENNRKMEQAFIVGIQEPGSPHGTAIEHLYELKELAKTLGLKTSGELIVSLKIPHPKFFIGSGKAEEIANLAKEKSCECIIVDSELSPSQQRNWEKLAAMPVFDRQEIIIDIFADRAISREAVIQVELARLQYMLPRLARAWTHLSRQKGGAMGTRGEGEQQIEVDRRIVKKKIAHYQRDIKDVKQHRETQRKLRDKNRALQAAIVGYTNAGKSSLMNALCGSSVLVEDKLFATLDPTTRQIKLLNNQPLLLTDTVGFIRKLPHTLVEAFKSTLEEAVLSDMLIHVVDISDPYFEEHQATTLSVLGELGAKDKDIITVFNKIDVQDDILIRRRLEAIHPASIFISAKNGEGIDDLLSALTGKARHKSEILSVKLPPERHDLAALAYKSGKVISSEYDEDGNLHLTISVDKAISGKFAEFKVQIF